MLGISVKRVYQYIEAGRLPAIQIGRAYLLTEEEIAKFKPNPTGRVRERAPSWYEYRSSGMLYTTEIIVAVRPEMQQTLLERLRVMREEDHHALTGTVARYIVKGDEQLSSVSIILVWKNTELPDEATRETELNAFKDALADVLDWDTAQFTLKMNQTLLHT